MIEHLSIGVSDLRRAGSFYDAVLGVLGYVRLFGNDKGVGYGRPGDEHESFAILPAVRGEVVPGARFHLAFVAQSRRAVDEFHRAALANGGSDDGPPGLRPEDPYGAGYYAAFVRDPDGYRLEAVALGAPSP